MFHSNSFKRWTLVLLVGVLAALAMLAGCGNKTPTTVLSIAEATSIPTSSPSPTITVPVATSDPPTSTPPPATATRPPAPTPDLSGLSTADLVKAIVQGPSLSSALSGTEQALARGGVATTDIDKVYVPAVKPAASMVAAPGQVMSMALEARRRATAGTLTVEELGKMLSDYGWPFPSTRTPGQHIIQFFSAWIAEAQKASADPQSFNALFIAELAKRQVPAVDLASGQAKPEDVRLTMLELDLFAAAFDRAVTPSTSGATPLMIDPASPERFITGWINNLVPAAAAEGPCTDVKKRFGDLAEVAGGSLVKVGFKPAVILALEKAGVLSEVQAEVVKISLHAVGMAARIWQLIQAYRHGEVVVSVLSSNPIHKPFVAQPAGFAARVGVSDEDWKDYQDYITNTFNDEGFGREVKDCLEALGLPTNTDVGDIAEQSQKWTVTWSMVKGSPELGVIDASATDWYSMGNYMQRPQKSGDHSGQAILVVDIKPEELADHPGMMLSGDLVVKAEVNTSPGPSAETWFNGTQGGFGIAQSLVDLTAGWIQTMVPLKSYGTLTVTWHKPMEFTLDVRSKIGFWNGIGNVQIWVLGTVPLKCEATWPAESAKCQGDAPLEVTGFIFRPDDPHCTGCFSLKTKTTEPASVFLTIPYDPHSGQGINMTFIPGEDHELYYGQENVCCHNWWLGYMSAHGGPAVPGAPVSAPPVPGAPVPAPSADNRHTGLDVSNWTVLDSQLQLGSTIYARAIFKGTVKTAMGPVDEDTTFDLKAVSKSP